MVDERENGGTQQREETDTRETTGIGSPSGGGRRSGRSGDDLFNQANNNNAKQATGEKKSNGSILENIITRMGATTLVSIAGYNQYTDGYHRVTVEPTFGDKVKIYFSRDRKKTIEKIANYYARHADHNIMWDNAIHNFGMVLDQQAKGIQKFIDKNIEAREKNQKQMYAAREAGDTYALAAEAYADEIEQLNREIEGYKAAKRSGDDPKLQKKINEATRIRYTKSMQAERAIEFAVMQYQIADETKMHVQDLTDDIAADSQDLKLTMISRDKVMYSLERWKQYSELEQLQHAGVNREEIKDILGLIQNAVSNRRPERTGRKVDLDGTSTLNLPQRPDFTDDFTQDPDPSRIRAKINSVKDYYKHD